MSRLKLERVSGAATISRHERLLAIEPALIDSKAEDAQANPRQREIHVLNRGDSDTLQRMLNALQPSSYIRPHRHVQPPKAETFVLLRGSVGFMTFLDDGTPDESGFVHLHPTKALALDCREGVWHTFFALEPNTVVFEVKAGPFDAATDKEFAPWAPAEGTLEAEEYLSRLKETFRMKIVN